MSSSSTDHHRSNGLKDLNSNGDLLNFTSSNPVFILREKRSFAYEERPIPTLPSEDYVLVAVHATGLCGSDIHYWTHGEIGDFKVKAPLVLGHESAGVVQKCGSSVRSLKPGDRVALEPGVPCRTCEYCQAGKYNLCPEVRFAATPPHDGTLAKYYTLPESLCYELPAHITLEEGALVEPLSVAVHCAKLANISFGSSVLVLGAGPIGLLCCAVARAFGAANVVAVDIVAARLQFALKYAATAIYEMQQLSSEENAQRLMFEAHVNNGAEVVIDATGAQACIGTGIHAMKKGGTFVQAGLGAPHIQFPVAQLCAKEGVYRGSFRYGPGDYWTAVQLVKERRITLKELITHTYGFSEAEKAFENVEQRQGIKTIIYGPDVDGGFDSSGSPKL